MYNIKKRELILELESLTAVVVGVSSIPGYRTWLLHGQNGGLLCAVASEEKIDKVIAPRLEELLEAVLRGRLGAEQVMKEIRALWVDSLQHQDLTHIDMFPVYTPDLGLDNLLESEVKQAPANMEVKTLPFNECKQRFYLPGSAVKGVIRSIFSLYNDEVAKRLFGGRLGGGHNGLPRSKVIVRDEPLRHEQVVFVASGRLKMVPSLRISSSTKYALALRGKVEIPLVVEEHEVSDLLAFNSSVKDSYIKRMQEFADRYARGRLANSWLFSEVIPRLVELNREADGIITLMGAGGLGLLQRLGAFVEKLKGVYDKYQESGSGNQGKKRKEILETIPMTGEVIISVFKGKHKKSFSIYDQIGLVKLKIKTKAVDG